MVDPLTAFGRCFFTRLFKPSLRTPRSEYIWGIIFLLPLLIFINILSRVIEFDAAHYYGTSSIIWLIPSLVGLLQLWLLIAWIMLSIRRLHDIDRSGWWALLCFLPLINLIMMLVLMFPKGTAGANRFGEDPLLEWPTAGPFKMP